MDVLAQARQLLIQAGFKEPYCAASYVWKSSTKTAALIALEDIRPPLRSSDVYLLDTDRAESIVSGIASGEEIPPIEVYPIIGLNTIFKYALFDGYHRYHLSIAAGFTHIPALIGEDLFARN